MESPEEAGHVVGNTRLAALKADTFALYLACRDPRVPWPAKLVAGFVVAYVLSPIDLVPDFIPFLGQLDDLLIVPLGLALAIRMVPRELLAEHRARAAEILSEPRGSGWRGIAIVAGLWVLGLVLLTLVASSLLGEWAAPWWPTADRGW